MVVGRKIRAHQQMQDYQSSLAKGCARSGRAPAPAAPASASAGSRPGGRQAAANSSIPILFVADSWCTSSWPRAGKGERANRKKSRKKNRKSTGKGMSANSSSAPSFRSTAGNDFAQAKETSGGISVAGLSEDELTASASAHRDFLLQTLHNVREQLSNLAPWLSQAQRRVSQKALPKNWPIRSSCLTCPLSKVVKKKKKRKRKPISSSTKQATRGSFKSLCGDFAG